MTDDAIVIGGGVIGLSVAWRLAERRLRVLVLERAHSGAGSSPRAAARHAGVATS